MNPVLRHYLDLSHRLERLSLSRAFLWVMVGIAVLGASLGLAAILHLSSFAQPLLLGLLTICIAAWIAAVFFLDSRAAIVALFALIGLSLLPLPVQNTSVKAVARYAVDGRPPLLTLFA